MKHLLAIILILAISAPAPLYAQDPADPPALVFVEKPKTTMCGDPPAKCFDMANFKLYLQMRTQYVDLFKSHTVTWPAIESELKNSAEAYQQVATTHDERADRWEKAYNELFPKYEDATHRAEKAEAHSVWGGGLPWLFTALAVGVAGGTVLGIYLEAQATQ